MPIRVVMGSFLIFNLIDKMSFMKIAALILMCLLSACNSSPQNTELVGANVDFVDSYSLPTPAPRPINSNSPSQESTSETPRFDNSNRPVAYASPPFGGRVPTDKMIVEKGLECLTDIKKSLSQKANKEIAAEINYPFVQILGNNQNDEYWQFEADVSNNYSQVVPGYEASTSIKLLVVYTNSSKSFHPFCSITSKVINLSVSASSKPKSSATPKPIKTAIPFTDLPVLGLTTKY